VAEAYFEALAKKDFTAIPYDDNVMLRVADRFTVNCAGKIIEQENHFDPRDVTNPGWQNG
jgi:hypothetical protein